MPELSKAYEPQAVEAQWYQFWLDEKCFTAEPSRVTDRRPAYSIVIPPPNVTGVLTLGHVLNNTIQDILARKARMEGHEVLWLPGTDHAGIATQTVVERTLKKAGEIRHRDDLGRDAFLARVWEWKEKHGGIILQQLRALGASCDWTRTRFTMDPEYSRCVQKVFVDLYQKGLIYRGRRMVNWCPVSLTALSDEEVIMKEQKGFMYHFRVEVAERPGTFLTIATTRPETIPADVAVAVNPKDPRYQDLIGLHVVKALPVEAPREQRLIPIIADDQVDFAFGTGVLKVTPAHDKVDFEIGQRHGLPVIEVLTPTGHLTAVAGPELAGMDRFAGRAKAAEILSANGALDKAEPYVNNVGFSERADVPVEPRLSEQWFLRYPSVEESRKVVAEGRMKFHPERWAKVYDHWMGNLQDWCISRQLWWGHRVPVWTRRFAAGETVRDPGLAGVVSGSAPTASVSLTGAADTRTFLRREQDSETGGITVIAATDSAAEAARLENDGFSQDPDVLDTWFSSWLWPFATMGWPGDSATLKKFYPTTDLVTGPDIIFFWVARMIMAGYEYLGEMPFRNVYFTGIIRDKQGRKMSKSLGNSPDPLDLIGKFGADALRFGVMRSAPLGQDVLFDEQSVELGRNFCNKLWNACRFRQMHGGSVQAELDGARLQSIDQWILLKLDGAIREVSTALANYNFSEATQALYRFFWSEYCDWYLEAAKAVLYGQDEAQKGSTLAVIDFVLSHTLRLFHPFLPFITEELWHGLGYHEDMPAEQGGRTILFAPWPKGLSAEEREALALDDNCLAGTDRLFEGVTLGRNLRREAGIDPARKVRFLVRPDAPLAQHDLEVLRLLLNAEAVEVVDAAFAPATGTPFARGQVGDLFLPLAGLVDVEAERARLEKELARTAGEIEKVQAKLGNPNFTQKVPANVLAEHQQRLADWQARAARVQEALAGLAAL